MREGGRRNSSNRGDSTELIAAVLRLDNPRARISRSETRGKLIGALGELCWYLSGDNSGAFITYYLPKYRSEVRDNIVRTGYGPRLRSWGGKDQLDRIAQSLRARAGTRRAIVQLVDPSDFEGEEPDPPCTCGLQFFLRDGKLSMMTMMRSNDVHLGLPHDVFCFTMLQEIVAREVRGRAGSRTE